IPAFGGTLTLISILIPTLLLVATLSGALHLASYWKHEARREAQGAIVRSIIAARTPSLLAALATALAVGALWTVPFSPIRQFGLYSAIGTLIAMVGLLYGIPALLQAWPQTQPVAIRGRTLWTTVGRFIVRHSTTMTVCWVLVAGVSFYGLTR